MLYKDEVITVRFDKDMLKGFSGYDTENPDEYFKEHPRAKKPPMDSLWKKSRNGLIPSINLFINCPNRVIQNTWEQHLKEYCEYCMEQQGIKHDYIDECIVLVVQFKPTRSESDVNNVYTKPFIDAMVERELLIDDNYKIVRLHHEYSVVDKKDPHSEIRIYPITGTHDMEFVLWYIQQEILELEKKYFGVEK